VLTPSSSIDNLKSARSFRPLAIPALLQTWQAVSIIRFDIPDELAALGWFLGQLKLVFVNSQRGDRFDGGALPRAPPKI